MLEKKILKFLMTDDKAGEYLSKMKSTYFDDFDMKIMFQVVRKLYHSGITITEPTVASEISATSQAFDKEGKR